LILSSDIHCVNLLILELANSGVDVERGKYDLHVLGDSMVMTARLATASLR
jgi:hypothetical protein